MASEVKVGKKAASAVNLPSSDHVNLFVDAADDKLKAKDWNGELTSLVEGGEGGGGTVLSPDIVAGLEGANGISADNVVATIGDLPAPAEPIPAAALTADQVAGLAGSTTPVTAVNPVISVADLPAPPAAVPADALTADHVAAISGAATALTGDNPVVSAADLAAAIAPAGLLTALSVDPSVGAGVQAYAPKLGLRQASGGTELWVKIGAAATAWHRLYPVCAPTPSAKK